MDQIRTLFTIDAPDQQPVLPEHLRALYGGDLTFPDAPDDRPYVVENFVSTIDGIVSFNLPGQLEGAQISGSNQPDRFIMGLLRASADAVMVGSGTVRATGKKASWLPGSIYPAAKDLYREYRTEVLKNSTYPLVVIITASGRLDLASGIFHTPQTTVLIFTTELGRQSLEQSGADSLPSVKMIVPIPTETIVSPSAMLRMLRREFGVKLLLQEGGPTVFGEFLAQELVDELFLTIAPQIAGRRPAYFRPSLVEHMEFSPDTARWSQLISAKASGSYLYLRYRFNRALPRG